MGDPLRTGGGIHPQCKATDLGVPFAPLLSPPPRSEGAPPEAAEIGGERHLNVRPEFVEVLPGDDEALDLSRALVDLPHTHSKTGGLRKGGGGQPDGGGDGHFQRDGFENWGYFEGKTLKMEHFLQ